MDAFFYHLTETGQLWAEYSFTDRDDVEVSEVWNTSSPFSFTIAHRTIPAEEIERWLQELMKPHNGDRQSCVFRMAWIEHKPKEHTNDISRNNYGCLVEAFHLGFMHKIYSTSFAGMTSHCQNSDSGSTTRLYSFCIHPKVTICWSYNVAEQFTQGICMASAEQIRMLKKLLHENLAEIRQDMTIALCCGMVLSSEIDHAQKVLKNEVAEVEVRTGHHRWVSRSEKAAPGALGALSARMSGCATKTASIERKTRVLEELNKFAVEQLNGQADSSQNNAISPDEVERSDRSRRLLKWKITQVDKRSVMQKIDTDFLKTRTQIQLSALFNLIAQNDALVGHEVAMDSKLLALASQRDSSSMKSLSIVTMFFLPGTFVASFFAMPVLEWIPSETSHHVIFKPGFVLYWTITIPLTLLTFVIWALWTLSQGLKHRKQNVDAKTKLNHDLTEMGALEVRRSFTSSSQHKKL